MGARFTGMLLKLFIALAPHVGEKGILTPRFDPTALPRFRGGGSSSHSHSPHVGGKDISTLLASDPDSAAQFQCGGSLGRC